MRVGGGVDIPLHALLNSVVVSVPDRFVFEKDDLPNWTGDWAPIADCTLRRDVFLVRSPLTHGKILRCPAPNLVPNADWAIQASSTNNIDAQYRAKRRPAWNTYISYSYSFILSYLHVYGNPVENSGGGGFIKECGISKLKLEGCILSAFSQSSRIGSARCTKHFGCSVCKCMYVCMYVCVCVCVCVCMCVCMCMCVENISLWLTPPAEIQLK